MALKVVVPSSDASFVDVTPSREAFLHKLISCATDSRPILCAAFGQLLQLLRMQAMRPAADLIVQVLSSTPQVPSAQKPSSRTKASTSR